MYVYVIYITANQANWGSQKTRLSLEASHTLYNVL